MKTSNSFFYALVILIFLAISACNEDLPEPLVQSKDKGKNLIDQKNARFFTGRDSLQGVAFKARVTGEYNGDNLNLSQRTILEGEGKATHMAHVNVLRSHMIKDGHSIEDGEFRYLSFTGDEIFGTYEGSQGSVNSDGAVNFEIREEITGGTGHFAGVVGVINTTGILFPDGTFSYSSDGWMSNNKSNKNKQKE